MVTYLPKNIFTFLIKACVSIKEVRVEAKISSVDVEVVWLWKTVESTCNCFSVGSEMSVNKPISFFN
jgi:hypothetical protein